jgi:murein L,D-transpeptidase YcbB/YkuD
VCAWQNLQSWLRIFCKIIPNGRPLKMEEAMGAGKEEWVKLPAAVPVSIIYLTAWVDHDGILNFRDDVYELDNTMPVAANSGF